MFSQLQFWGAWLKVSPMDFAIYLVFLVVSVLGSLTLHEYAHGYAAYRCGDPTAKMLGRLSLNPIKHLDPFGTIAMFTLGFGWAKPVPVNPRNFRNAKRDDIIVSLAGIVVNLTLFIVSLALCVWLNQAVFDSVSDRLDILEYNKFIYNFTKYSFRGDSLLSFTNQPVLFYVHMFFSMLAAVNVGLGLFNLLPIPPLDGFHVLNDLVLRGKVFLGGQVFRIMQVVLIVAIFSGFLDKFLFGFINTVYGGVLHLLLMMTGQA